MIIKTKNLLKTGAAICAVVCLPLSAAAQEVRLTSTDGFIDFSGALVSFADGVYTIETSMGRLTFPATEVTCEGDACPETNEVASAFQIIGSPAVLSGLIPELLDNYSLDADTDIVRSDAGGTVAYQLLTFEGELVADVSIVESSVADAAQRLAQGETLLAVVPGRLTDAQALDVGSGVETLARRGFETRIASDAMVVLVGSDAGISALRPSELTSIFSGDVTNWSELGGADLPIVLFAPSDGSDVYDVLNTRLLAPARKSLAPEAVRVETDNNVVDAIARFPNGIAVAALSGVASDAVIAVADACGRPVPPTPGAVKTGRYPFAMEYHVYASTSGVPVHARGLVDFAASTLGQELVASAGFLSLGIETIEDTDLDYGTVTAGAQPLSAALTVSSRGAALDALDRAALDRLADVIRGGRIEGSELIFVGVSPDDASAPEAVAAARTALRALFAAHADVEEQLTVGFKIGAATAAETGSACIADLEDAVRVEIWSRTAQDNG